ncbi:hypothetical protein HOY82DRAFT_73507 [Tuber indicum]|nr:hypothetical protein HOY82DRAFT_73507 [Tuber indicum]
MAELWLYWFFFCLFVGFSLQLQTADCTARLSRLVISIRLPLFSSHSFLLPLQLCDLVRSFRGEGVSEWGDDVFIVVLNLLLISWKLLSKREEGDISMRQ